MLINGCVILFYIKLNIIKDDYWFYKRLYYSILMIG